MHIPRLVAIQTLLAVALLSQSPKAAAPVAGQPTNSMRDTIARIAEMNQLWGRALSSPGASLRLQKLAGGAGQTFKYHLYAEGLPPSETYTLRQWPITQNEPSDVLKGVTLNAEGLAICTGKPGLCGTAAKPNDPIDLTVNPAKGEPFRISLVATGATKKKAFLKIVPFPNEASDKACRLQAVLLMPRAEEVAIEGSGFKPGADLITNTASGPEHLTGKAKADAQGRFFSVVLPHRKGEQKGTTQFEVKSADCGPLVSFNWGAQN